jgi:hypothetical protein
MTEQNPAAVFSKATYAAGTMTAVAGLTLAEWVAVVGLLVTIATFVATMYFRIRDDRRAQREHEQRMQEISNRADLGHNSTSSEN